MTNFGAARAVADAVLYEGYLLYPYTASAPKNRLRWQFGVVVPQTYEAAGTGEHGEQQTEVLLEAAPHARLDILVRFLQVESRAVEAFDGSAFSSVASLRVNDATYVTFEEAVEREVALNGFDPRSEGCEIFVRFDGARALEILEDEDGVVAGRIVRERWPLCGSLTVHAVPLPVPGAPSLFRMRVRLENHSAVVASDQRSLIVRTAFVSAHTLLHVEGGAFLSPLDAPEYAVEATAALQNRFTWPVLVGDPVQSEQRASLALSSPIILGDFPRVAKATEADAFDATEIDELLTLSVLSLSDAERAEARATDPRAGAIVERAERFGADSIARLHDGDLQALGHSDVAVDPFASIDAPAPEFITIEGLRISKGASVRLAPKRRADAWDMFLAGKIATVQRIHQDVEDKLYVSVTVDDDPASELHEWYGRSFFFEPDEVEPLRAAP